MGTICALKATSAALALLGACLQPAVAESNKFFIDGDRLVYDTESPGATEDKGIANEDVALLLALLRDNPELKVLQLNSSGGAVYAAIQMSDIVVDFDLDTHVHGDCDSSCVTVFLAGDTRTMSRGSRIGFHQIYWAADNIEAYYERERAENGWSTPFEFAEWMYLDTQDEIYAHLRYMIDRGVDPAFAVETIRNPHAEMWRPYRAELLKAGVLTE